jgi:spore germination protein YaaH
MKKILRLCLMLLLSAAVCSGGQGRAAEYKYNMSYIYYGDSSGYAGYVERTDGSLNEISPYYFSLTADGSLHVNASADKSFVKTMHEQGVLVVPYLSNDWDRGIGIAALRNRENLSSEIAAAVTDYELDGVNVDIENVTAEERAAYVEFMRLLREKLPADKRLTVSVAANPYGTNAGWQGSYDYAGLAQVCDYLMIMAYDEHYYTGPSGPVSSLSFTERSLQYALKLVPKEKIVLGLPFYGRIWSNAGGYPNGYGVSNHRIDKLVRDYRGKTVFHEGSRTAYAEITISSWDTKPVVGGRALSAGTYTIWYENERSIQEKLILVEKYDIKGTGSWSLGQETQSTWDYYRFWLNGCYFTDIQSSWAKNEILEAFVHEWINGESASRFNPEQPLTRAQAAVMLVRLMNLTPEVNDAAAFLDCKDRGEEPYINTARRNGLVSGVGNNLFHPDRRISREEMAVMLNNILGFTGSNPDREYTDVSVSGNSWSYADIHALSEQSILTGYPDGCFLPEQNLTRAEMTVLLGRLNQALKLY